jgi:hypothetical protein
MNISFPTIPNKPSVNSTRVRGRWALAQEVARKFAECSRDALSAMRDATREIATACHRTRRDE